MSLPVSAFDLSFWLLIALIAAVAFGIESGVVSRHRRLVVSSLLTFSIATLMMLFLVEDNSSFATTPHEVAKKGGPKKISGVDGDLNEGDPMTGEAGKWGGAVRATGGGLRDCATCPTFIVINKGHFDIGSYLTEKGRGIGESPRKQVVIGQPFGMSMFEVLRVDFEEFVRETEYESQAECRSELDADTSIDEQDERPVLTWRDPGFEQGPRHPVVCVSPRDAKAYVLWLSEKTGKKYRLASQAEWEFVARAGSQKPFAFGDVLTREQARWRGDVEGTVDAGTFPANDLKVHAMHGNVWEITADCWSPDLTQVPKDGGAVGIAGDCTRYVIKGGGWDSEIDKLRSAARANIGENAATPSVGFRIVRVL
ncbi:MAG: SUMF1/EgtB/PvdO family nonheme iron enzyme [Pseudomonadota bacterium]